MGSVVFAAIIKFAALPALETFPAFCAAIGLFLIPASFALARSRQPAAMAVFTAMGMNFMPLLAPTNEMSYDTVQFYNTALSVVVGCGVAPLAFCLLPPVSPALRARRLLSFTLHDLRRLAIGSEPPRSDDWDGRVLGRLTALPDQAEPLQRARLLAALSVGAEIIRLRQMAAKSWSGRGARRRVRGHRAGTQRDGNCAATSTRSSPRLQSRLQSGNTHRASGAQSHLGHL